MPRWLSQPHADALDTPADRSLSASDSPRVETVPALVHDRRNDVLLQILDETEWDELDLDGFDNQTEEETISAIDEVLANFGAGDLTVW